MPTIVEHKLSVYLQDFNELENFISKIKDKDTNVWLDFGHTKLEAVDVRQYQWRFAEMPGEEKSIVLDLTYLPTNVRRDFHET